MTRHTHSSDQYTRRTIFCQFSFFTGIEQNTKWFYLRRLFVRRRKCRRVFASDVNVVQNLIGDLNDRQFVCFDGGLLVRNKDVVNMVVCEKVTQNQLVSIKCSCEYVCERLCVSSSICQCRVQIYDDFDCYLLYSNWSLTLYKLIFK